MLSVLKTILKTIFVFLGILLLSAMIFTIFNPNEGEDGQELTFNYIANGVTIVNDNVNCTQYIKTVDSIYPRLDKNGKIVKIDNCAPKNNMSIISDTNNKINADHQKDIEDEAKKVKCQAMKNVRILLDRDKKGYANLSDTFKDDLDNFDKICNS